MSNAVYVGQRIRSFETAPVFDGYTKVVITVSDDVEYTAGQNTGRTLTLECPWGTQEMAQNILNHIQGFQYQPYRASGALVDPAAELGDGITVNNIYSGMYQQDLKFGPLMSSEIVAPTEETIDHEYPYKPKQERRVTRKMRQLSAELKIQAGLISAEVAERKSDVESINSSLQLQADKIDAKVSSSGGNASSFGWSLTDRAWTIQSGSTEILRASKEGLEIYGKIVATSGRIGGFDITSNSLSFNNQTWGGTNTTGVYIGPSGIQLGKNFKVDSAGNLTAASGTFSGQVQAGNIQYGGDAGTLSGKALSVGSVSGGYGGAIGGGTLTTFNTGSGINASLGYADFANGFFNGWNTASYGQLNTLKINELFILRNSYVKKRTLRVMTGPDSYADLNYLTYEATP